LFNALSKTGTFDVPTPESDASISPDLAPVHP
jgi:hypothetical protein